MRKTGTLKKNTKNQNICFNVLMKFTVSLLSLLFSLTLFSNDIPTLSDEELEFLITDETIRYENVLLNQLQIEAYVGITSIESDVQKVSNTIFAFANEEISYDDLWLILDPIKEGAFNSSEALEDSISKLNFRSQSDKAFFAPLYNLGYENLSILNNFLRDFARNLVNQIESIENGDIDKYDMYLSQSQILGAKANLRQAVTKEIGAKIMPASNINHFLGQFDAHLTRVAAYFLLINGTYMLNELDKKQLKEYVSNAEESFDMLANKSLKRNMFRRMESLESKLMRFANDDEMGLVRQTKQWLELYYLSSINISENYLKMLELYIKNQDKFNYSETEGAIQNLSEWDYLNSRITIDSDQNAKAALAFNDGFIEIGNILIKYRDVYLEN